MQKAIDDIEYEGFQQLIKANTMEKLKKTSGWSIVGLLKKLFGLLIGISLVGIIAFPKPTSMYPDTIENLDKVVVRWNRTEQELIMSKPTQTMKDELMLELAREKLAVKKAEEAEQMKKEDQRVKDYVAQRVKGMGGPKQVALGAKEDARQYAMKNDSYFAKFVGKGVEFLDYMYPPTPEDDEEEAEVGSDESKEEL